jgi:hypothetical protein
VNAFVPHAEKVDVIDEGRIVFVDAGANFGAVRCNSRHKDSLAGESRS